MNYIFRQQVHFSVNPLPLEQYNGVTCVQLNCSQGLTRWKWQFCTPNIHCRWQIYKGTNGEKVYNRKQEITLNYFSFQRLCYLLYLQSAHNSFTFALCSLLIWSDGNVEQTLPLFKRALCQCNINKQAQRRWRQPLKCPLSKQYGFKNSVILEQLYNFLCLHFITELTQVTEVLCRYHCLFGEMKILVARISNCLSNHFMESNETVICLQAILCGDEYCRLKSACFLYE